MFYQITHKLSQMTTITIFLLSLSVLYTDSVQSRDSRLNNDQMVNKLAETKFELDKQLQKLNTTKAELAETEVELLDKVNQLNSVTRQVEVIKSEYERVAFDLDAVAGELDHQQSELLAVKVDLTSYREMLNATKNELSEVRDDLKSHEKMLNVTKKEHLEAESKLDSILDMVIALKAAQFSCVVDKIGQDSITLQPLFAATSSQPVDYQSLRCNCKFFFRPSVPFDAALINPYDKA